MGRNYWRIAQTTTQLLCFITFTGSVHKKAARHRRGAEGFQKFSALRRISRIAGGKEDSALKNSASLVGDFLADAAAPDDADSSGDGDGAV